MRLKFLGDQIKKCHINFLFLTGYNVNKESVKCRNIVAFKFYYNLNIAIVYIVLFHFGKKIKKKSEKLTRDNRFSLNRIRSIIIAMYKRCHEN